MTKRLRHPADVDGSSVPTTGPAGSHAAATDTDCASPPCYAGEADPVYMGYFSNDELLALLNLLLESERAGARATGEMCADVSRRETRILLSRISRDEARYCLMLTRHVERLGGEPSRATGPFYAKLLARRTLSDRMALLNAGQDWVMRKLDAALPRIADDGLRADLSDMLERHRRNTRLCEGIPR